MLELHHYKHGYFYIEMYDHTPNYCIYVLRGAGRLCRLAARGMYMYDGL